MGFGFFQKAVYGPVELRCGGSRGMSPGGLELDPVVAFPCRRGEGFQRGGHKGGGGTWFSVLVFSMASARGFVRVQLVGWNTWSDKWANPLFRTSMGQPCVFRLRNDCQSVSPCCSVRKITTLGQLNPPTPPPSLKHYRGPSL